MKPFALPQKDLVLHMRTVLHIRTSSQLLGAERVVLELAENLPSLGYKPMLCAPIENGEEPSELIRYAQELGIETFSPQLKGAFDLSVCKSLKHFIKQHNVDIVHSHGYRENFYALMSKGGKPLIATNHLWKRSNFKLKCYAIADAIQLHFFDHITAVSKPIFEDMARHLLPRSRMSLISNGINIQRFSKNENRTKIRAEFGLGEREIVIGTISSLTPEKGLTYLIDAINKLKSGRLNFKGLIIGDGSMKASLQQQVNRLGLQDLIKFSGRRSDIPDLLSAIDIFALPSLKEGLPIAMLEAMAAEKAVIATNVGDISSVINGSNGIMIQPQEVDELAHALQLLISDPKQLDLLGKKARQTVKNEFSAKHMTTQYVELYNNIIDKNALTP